MEETGGVASRAPRAQAFRLGSWLLPAFAVAIAIVRLRTYGEPWQRDITTYAVVGRELLHGGRLYAQLWDHKPPGIHATYALAQALVGAPRAAVYLLGVVAAWAALWGIARAARVATRDRAAGFWAAAFWVAVSADWACQAEEPNTEVFVNALVVWAFALWLEHEEAPRRFTRVALVSGLLALATLYKPNALIFPFAFALASVLASRPQGRRAGVWREVAALVAAPVLAWASVFAYFSARGCAREFWDATVIFNRFYVRPPLPNLFEALRPGRLFPAFVVSWLPLAVVTLTGVAFIRSLRSSRASLFAAYAGGVWVAIAVQGKFFPHYYQLWLPLLCVGAGVALARLRAAGARRFVGEALLLACLVLLQLPMLSREATEWSRRRWWGAIYVETFEEAHRVDRLLMPGELFYDWGAETGLYFETGRRPPTGVLYYYPLLAGPLVQPLTARALSDLERTRPELVVAHRSVPLPPEHPVVVWIERNYEPLEEAEATPFRHFVLRGGALQARLAHRPPGA